MEYPIIKNCNELVKGDKLREDALTILEAGYDAIDINKLVHSKVYMEDGHMLCFKDTKICLQDFERIFFIAIGKCANDSAKAFEEILGDKITSGIVLDVKGGNFTRMLSEVGTHPISSEKNVFVTQSIADILKNAGKKDLVISVISGGGSSLLCLPNKIDCKGQGKLTEELMNRGANIMELNTVRKHLSSIKGGQFAKIAYPATVASFILSDVPGDDLSVIASGPTVKDETTVEDAEKVLKKYELEDLFEELGAEFTETPKKDKYFEKVMNILLGSNMVALDAMKAKAEELGYDAFIESSQIEGEARDLGEKLANKQYLPGSCHLWGGETTVKVVGNGLGGRNQEFALGALPYVQQDMVILGAASDGWDNSDRAGAMVDDMLREKAEEMKMLPEKYLYENDSYEFFKEVGGHIETGRTGTNVADLYMVLVKKNK